MKNVWVLMSIFILGLTGCGLSPVMPIEEASPAEAFELYLLANENARGMDVIDTPLETLALADAPLLTTTDLVNYERSSHTIQLTDEGLRKVTALFEEGFQVAGIPFVIVARGERLYAGAFWTPLSSQSFDGVVIMDPVFSTENNTLQIALGYPGVDFYSGADPRIDARLLDALDEAGVLK